MSLSETKSSVKTELMLTEQLRQLQKGYGWSQAKMAKELGISRPLLSLVYSGKRNLQLKFIKGIIARFPELKQQIFKAIEDK